MDMKKFTVMLSVVLVLVVSAACGVRNGGSDVGNEGGYNSEGQYAPVVPDVKKQLADAHKENSDVVAWLALPNTKINEPVVQTTNNDEYIRKDAKKKYSYEGCYYIDYESVMFDDGKDLAHNTIIYGHNLGNPLGVKDDPEAAKFAQLLKLNDPEIAKKTPYVYLTTEGAEHIFEIFAVFYSEAVISPVPYHYAQYTETDFGELIKDVKARSEYTYDTDVNWDDKLLTLSTCSYKYGTYSQNPHQRYVVMARLVRKGEAFHEQANLKVNAAPKAPSF